MHKRNKKKSKQETPNNDIIIFFERNEMNLANKHTRTHSFFTI